MDQARCGPRGQRDARDGDEDRERTRSVQHVDLDREHVEQMRQRQPDRTDLLPAGHDAVEDTARDDEVGAGVVVAEREADQGVVDRRGAAEDEHERGGG